jgi:hypothetical protein
MIDPWGDEAKDLELIHDRRYEVNVYRLDESTLLATGEVIDTKPPDLYIENDPDTLEIHRMRVALEVRLPDLVITEAHTTLETFPTTGCPAIEQKYGELVGLTIARGFTHKVRELFGGPRGCTHTTALLQAMAPAVVQSTWSVSVADARAAGRPAGAGPQKNRDARFSENLNTCHVWDEDGEHVAAMRRDETAPPPLQVTERLVQLGRSPDEWRNG